MWHYFDYFRQKEDIILGYMEVSARNKSNFAKLSKVAAPEEEIDGDYKLTKKFFIVLNGKTTKTDDISSARWMLFTHGKRSMENTPPTHKALKHHIIRAALQACGMSVWRNNWLTAILLYVTDESLMNSVFRFGAIYQMQQSHKGNLSNAVARTHAKADETFASKNYSVQNDLPVQDSAMLF